MPSKKNLIGLLLLFIAWTILSFVAICIGDGHTLAEFLPIFMQGTFVIVVAIGFLGTIAYVVTNFF